MIQLNPRERHLAIGLIAALAAWAIWAVAVKPARERIGTLERILPEKLTQLRELQAKGVEYVALQNEFKDLRQRMAAQDPAFQLLPFLEAMIQRHKLAGHVTTMRQDVMQPQPDYSETVVTIDMQDVTLPQLINFLTAIETTDAVVQVGSLHIRKDATNDALLDSTVGIYSPRLANPGAPLARAP